MALREIIARFGIQFDGRPLDQGNRKIDVTKDRLSTLEPLAKRVTSALGALGIAVGGAAIVRQMSQFVAETIRIGDELDKTSRRLGISTQDLQAFSHAANLSGVSAEHARVGVATLNRQLYAANSRGGEAAEAFQRIGVAFNDAEGAVRPMGAVMADVADVIQRTENPTERAGIAMRLFGESGMALIPMLEDGREGMAAMAAELELLGGGMSGEAIEASAELTDNIARLRLSMLSVRSAIAVRVLPIVDRAVRAFTSFGSTLQDIASESRIFQVAITAAGAAAAVAAGLTIASWGPIVGVAALVAFLVLALDDLYVTALGGDSVIRMLLESMLGLDRAGTVIAGIRDAFEGAAAAAQAFSDAVIGVGAEVLRTFGIIGEPEVGVSGSSMTDVRGAGRGRTNPDQRAAARAVSPLTPAVAARERAAAIPRDLIRPSTSPMTVSNAVVPRVEQTVDARVDAVVTINEATDGPEVERRVGVAIRRAQEQQARQIQAALVPEGQGT